MIKDLVRHLKTVDQIRWGMYTLKRDPLSHKIPDLVRSEMIEKANECGCLEAQTLKAKYGVKTCREYSKLLGLTVSEIEVNNTSDYILFAKFNAPNQVSICINNVKKGEELIKKEDLYRLIDEVKIEDVLIAHEMFHFIEGKDKEIYTKRTKIRLWKLGPFKNDSGLVALGEIAAMAFAKELLQLSYCPNLFDILLLYPHDKKKAKQLYDEIIRNERS